MDRPTSVTRVWDCSFCDTSVDTTQTILHVESPLHRIRAEGPLRVNELAETWEQATAADGVEEFVGEDDDDEESDWEAEEDDAVEDDADDKESEDEEDDELNELSQAMYRVEEHPISHEEQLLGEPRTGVLWTCDICRTTIHANLRYVHVSSRPHVQAARAHTPSPQDQLRQPASLKEIRQPAPPTTWHCTLCAVTMTVVHQAVHITGKRHLKLVSQQRPRQSHQSRPNHRNTAGQSTILQGNANSTSYTVRNAAYRTKTTQQRAAPAQHPKIASNMLAPYGTPAPSTRFPCTIRQLPTDTTVLIITTAHESLTAQHGSSQSSTQAAAATTPTPADPWFCPRCGQHLHSELLSTHLLRCTVAAQTRAPPKSAAPKPKKVPARVQQTPRAPPVVATPFTTVTGDMFYCEVCVRTRSVVGMAGHVASRIHQRKVAAATARGGGPRLVHVDGDRV